MTAQLAQRLLARVEPCPRSECLLWTGAADAYGYGYLRCHPRFGLPFPEIARVHRLAYWLFRGPFDLDLTLNHDCTTRLCVNPYHLTPMTHGENCADANVRRWAAANEAAANAWGDWLDDVGEF